MKRLMILGAGTFQLPAIERGIELGYHVIALSNNPKDPGLAKAHEGHVVSTTDKEAVLQLARDKQIAGIATMASEVSAVTVAFVAEELGLPGYPYQSSGTMAFKHRLRAFLQERNLPSTPFGVARDYEQAQALYRELPKPVFLKPSSASGSRGAYLLKSEQDLEAKFPLAISGSILEKSVVLESFMQGKEVGGEVLIRDGQVIFCVPTKKYVTPQFVVYGHALPAELSDEESRSVRELIQQVVYELNLTSGALNFDIMICADGPHIIELGGRLGGNCLPDIMRIHTGIDTIEVTLRMAVGESIDALPPLASNPVGAYVFGSNKRGRLVDYLNFDSILSCDELSLQRFYRSYQVGDSVMPFTEGSHQAGFFIFTATTPEKVWATIEAAHGKEWVKVESNEVE